MSAPPKTLNMVIAALGGEGGAVLTDWLIAAADTEGWLCQTTSLAGVAQRTGATIYYLEFFPRSAVPPGKAPVMSLFPAQGDIDVAVASEAAEAARMVQRGFVSPTRTTLIASDHRVYGITEREHLGDGTIDLRTVREIAQRNARDFIHFDMMAIANATGTPISAVLLGAIAGAGVLPFGRASFEAAISAGGKAVETNMRAFTAGFEQAGRRGVEWVDPTPAAKAPFVLPTAQTAAGATLLKQLGELPAACHETGYRALLKLVDYQDHRYAQLYLQRLAVIAAHNADDDAHTLLCETARYLALLMCFEDIPRVAQLKIRAGREALIREEVLAKPGQIITVTEFFRPRVEEICAMLPAGIGRRLLESALFNRLLKPFTRGQRLKTNHVWVHAALSVLAWCRRLRRATLGYEHEWQLINRWLAAIENALQHGDQPLALQIVELGRLVKGYGDTRARTRGQVMRMLDMVESGEAISAQRLAALHQAALGDDSGRQFDAALAAAS